jgi:hypothetical protein
VSVSTEATHTDVTDVKDVKPQQPETKSMGRRSIWGNEPPRQVNYLAQRAHRGDLCPSTALVRDPAEVLPKAVYELGVSALNLVHMFGVKRCVVNSNTLFRTERNSV